MQVAESLLSSTSRDSPDEPLRATATPPGQAISSSSVAEPVQVAMAETVPPPAAAYETDVEGASIRPCSGLVGVAVAPCVLALLPPAPLAPDDVVGGVWWWVEVRGADDVVVVWVEVRGADDVVAVWVEVRGAGAVVAVRVEVRGADDVVAVRVEVRGADDVVVVREVVGAVRAFAVP